MYIWVCVFRILEPRRSSAAAFFKAETLNLATKETHHWSIKVHIVSNVPSDLLQTEAVIFALIITTIILILIIIMSNFIPVKNCWMNRGFRLHLCKQNASCMVDLRCLINKMATLIPEVAFSPMKVSCSGCLVSPACSRFNCLWKNMLALLWTEP